MTEMTPETRQELPLMPYGEGSRTCALACLEVLDPKDAMAQWIRAYLEHTAALEARIEALETALKSFKVRLVLCNCGFHGFEDALAHNPSCPYRAVLDAHRPDVLSGEEETTTIYATTISDEEGRSLGDDASLAAE
jgi:hypothetical protein